MASSKPTQRVLTQGKKVVTSTNKKPVRTVLENKDDSDESQGESADKINKRTKVIRPNAFLSFRITSRDVRNHVFERINDRCSFISRLFIMQIFSKKKLSNQILYYPKQV